ncbi:MAG TPA: two-component regulator propeller domain-containing protein, partial [Cytophaga sp.]|nr:two-component regulator propeller domain-containing protein [Cytophaga sp.]
TNSFTDLRNQYGRMHVRDIYIDTDQSIWLATTLGMRLIDPNTNKVTSFTHSANDSKTLNGNNTIRITPYKNYLFIGIDSDGLDLYDKKTKTFYHYNKQSGAQLSTNNITAVYIDSKGTLWTGTFLNGVNFSNSATNFFVYVKNNSSKSNSVTNGVVTSFLKDSKNNFWITTDGGGIYLKKNKTQSFINYTAFDAHPLILSNAALGAIEDSQGNIWISTYNGGITRITPDGKSTIFKNDPLDPKSLSWNKIKGLCEYNDEIWGSTFGMGLSVFNKKTETFRHYRNNPNDPKSIPSEWSYWFLKDSRGNLWVATFAGLCKYLPDEDAFKTYKLDNSKIVSDKNYVFDIFEDSKQRLWLGTNGGGLILFDRDKETFTSYTTDQGLSDNTVKSVIEDNNGMLWLATNNGITQFNPEAGKAIAYTIKDGLPAGSFYYNSQYKDEEGKIYFGMNDGYLVINPALTNETLDFPKVVLTDFRIFNVPVRPNAVDSPLDKSITEATSIKLPYDQNSISIQFAALNFTIPRHNYYSYKLEGFDKNWNNAGKNREAKYTNLDPGTYTLKVRASNNEKTFGEAYTSFEIIITPPFWETWWFRTLIVIFAITGIVGFFYLRTENIRKRNKLLSDEVRNRTKELEDANRSLTNKNELILTQQKELLDKKYTLEKNNDKLSEWNTFQQKLIGIIGHDIRGPL